MCQRDVFSINVGDEIKIKSPIDGSEIKKIIPKFGAIISNLPFVEYNKIAKDEQAFITEIRKNVQDNTGIEFTLGKTDLYKPISCHLYPIRIGDYGPYKAVNYHRWDVCKAAILLGQKENLPVYKFLKEPLIRKFGEDWYAELELVVEEMKKQGIL